MNRNRDRHIHARGRVHQKNATELLNYQSAPVRPANVFCGPGLEGLHVEPVVRHHLRDLLGLGVVSIERDRTVVLPCAVAVREEVDLVADPYRVGVVGVIAGNFDQVESLEVDDPDGAGLAADVALPGRLPLGIGLIGYGLAVGREGGLEAGGQWQRLGNARAVGMNAEEAQVMAIAGRHAGDQ